MFVFRGYITVLANCILCEITLLCVRFHNSIFTDPVTTRSGFPDFKAKPGGNRRTPGPGKVTIPARLISGIDQ